MTRFRCPVWCWILVLVTTTSVVAQPPGSGRRGGFGGGFGAGGGNAPWQLAGNPTVQKELGLNEDQIAKISALGEEARRALQSALEGGVSFQDLQDLPDDQRRARMNEMRAKMSEATNKVNDGMRPKLDAILDVGQRERLQQIAWQVAGSQAYQDPGLVAALKLSAEQQEKLAAVVREFGEKQQELMAGGFDGSDFQERMAKMRELNEARDSQISQVLTDAQRVEFEKLKGKPFDVAQLRGGGRGGIGGGAGGPGGGGRGGAGGGGPGGRGPDPSGRPKKHAQTPAKKHGDQ